MRREVSNSVYGLLDYAAYPVGMLAVAPIILRNLGAAQYGAWTVATATVSVGSIVASGFGDANIHQVATWRNTSSGERVIRIVRSALAIHLALGFGIALVIWVAAPILANRMALRDAALYPMCLGCIRIAALLTLIRSVEAVCISTQRGFERYGAAVKMSVAGRLLGLASAAILALASRDVTEIMAATTAFAALSLVWQFVDLRRLLRVASLSPAIDRAATREILRFGLFTWILAVTGVAFSQSDRLIGGTSMGASAVVAYALCAQLAQPIYGLTAAGLHFLFPYITSRRKTESSAEIRKAVLRAMLANILLVVAGTGVLLLMSRPLLRVLAGASIANSCAPLLPAIVGSSALLAFSVTGNYALLALGEARKVAAINAGACLAMFTTVAFLMAGAGVWAIIDARLAFGAIAVLVYIPLLRNLVVGEFHPQPVERQLAGGEGA